jgi:hypothetical protein
MDLEEIQLQRADEQMSDPRSYRLHHKWEKDPWNTVHDRPPPRPKPRAKCFACDREPMPAGAYAGYCPNCAVAIRQYNTTDKRSDYQSPKYRDKK